MNWITRAIRTRFEKQNPVSGVISVSPGQAAWTPRNYKKLSEEGYKKNNVCFSAINLVAENCSQVKYSLFQGDEPVLAHPVLDLLNNPNADMGRQEFIFALIAYRLINGNSYVNAVSPKAKDSSYDFEPSELWVNRADRYEIFQGSLMPVGKYVYNANGRNEEFLVDQVSGKSNVLQWKTFNPLNDFYGMSAIEAAAAGIDIYNQSMEWNKAFFDNGAKPSGALIYEGEGDPGADYMRDLKKQVDEIYSGKSSNGRPLVLNKLKWVQFSLSPKDMDFIAAKDTTSKDIARAFGVPPILLNIGSDSTFNNQAEARLALWEDTVMPLMGNYMSELNRWLIPRYGDDSLVLKADVSDVSALEPRREKLWKRAQESDFISYNEKRAIVNLGAVDGGDQIFISSSMIPITFDADNAANEAAEATESAKKSISDFEFKLINGSRQAEKREQAIQDRLMTTLERPFALKVAKVINKYVNKAAKAASSNVSGVNVNAETAQMEADLLKIYKPHYRSTMDLFGKRIVKGLKSVGDCLEIKDQADIFLTATNEWIDENAGSRVVMVTDTTKDDIMRAISKGIADSATGSEMAKLIKETAGGAISRTRSIAISRTETHTASQVASIEAAGSSGLALKKVWISAEDERSRDNHNETDRQTHAKPIDMDAMFQVGSDSMLSPGDGADASENVNCRCVIGYETGD